MTWDISGHEWAARLLKQHIMSGEVRHAYLFTGPSGVGRRTLPVNFAVNAGSAGRPPLCSTAT